jgi:hypothetical protein
MSGGLVAALVLAIVAFGLGAAYLLSGRRGPRAAPHA